MIRNLKALMLGAMALTAFSAVLASSALAHTPAQFTAPGVGANGETTITATRDDEGGTKPSTGHQVFDIRKADGTGTRSITCKEVTADGVIKGEAKTEVTVTFKFQTECNFVGQPVEVNSGACDFNFTADGVVHINTDTGVAGECKHGKAPITFNNPVLDCHVEVGEQTIAGITYHNIEVAGSKQITLSANNLAVTYNATGTGCPYGTTNNGLYTTGNTIVTGAKKAEPAVMVNIEWDQTVP